MTLEENIKAILECNFSIAREEVVESATKRIMEQISRQNPLEDIKAEIEGVRYSVNAGNDEFYVGVLWGIDTVSEIIEKHISELKGE